MFHAAKENVGQTGPFMVLTCLKQPAVALAKKIVGEEATYR